MMMADEGASGGPGNPSGNSRFEEMLRVPPGVRDLLRQEKAPGRRPRADARDNRARLLTAADAIFGTDGVGASLDLIAREAGVGRATLYRHFPSREALLGALHDGLLTTIEKHARGLGERGDALFELMGFYTDQVARRATLVDYWLTFGPDSDVILRARARMLDMVSPLLARAIDAGHCRAALTPQDMLVVFNMLTPRPVGRTGDERRVLGRRALELIMLGLRA